MFDKIFGMTVFAMASLVVVCVVMIIWESIQIARIDGLSFSSWVDAQVKRIGKIIIFPFTFAGPIGFIAICCILAISAAVWTAMYHQHLELQARTLDRLMEHQRQAHQIHMDLLDEMEEENAKQMAEPQSLLSRHAKQMAMGNYEPAIDWARNSEKLRRKAQQARFDRDWERREFEWKVRRIFNPSFEDQLDRLVEPVIEKHSRKLDYAAASDVEAVAAIVGLQIASQQAQNAVVILGIAEGAKELRKLARKKGISLSELAEAGLELRPHKMQSAISASF